MPEIKLKHVVSFSSEDKIHKAENLLKPETYRKWKCATPGEKKATVILQFEKASQIHSIDIGNESSAFVEILVGRSSDSENDFQVLLVASSFMSPLESRNETHTNRVRMFESDKLTHNIKDEKWDCVQIVCTQPFNKNITYGLTFVKFHSPPEKIGSTNENASKKTIETLGAFKLKSEDDDELPSIGSWFDKKKANKIDESSANPMVIRQATYASTVLASPYTATTSKQSPQVNTKRKLSDDKSQDSPIQKKESPITHVNKEKVGYKNIFGENANASTEIKNVNDDANALNETKNSVNYNYDDGNKKRTANEKVNVETNTSKEKDKVKTRPFNKIMEKVIFALSGFVNPLRSEIREKALEMGAKYRPDWDKTCTHLICAFINTPKYIQVNSQGGRIVTKEWIIDCHKRKLLIPWQNYSMNKTSGAKSSDESEEEIIVLPRNKKKESPKINNNSHTPSIQNPLQNSTKINNSPLKNPSTPKRKLVSPLQNKEETKKLKPSIKTHNLSKEFEEIVDKNNDSETEDEDALNDYLAETEHDSSSGGDTEDEILKLEKRQLNNKAANLESSKLSNTSQQEMELKPDTHDLPLPELPNLFKKKHFYLYGDFTPKALHDLQRYITAYNGVLESFMSETVKYVITELKWDEKFDEAICENEDLVFVKPQWIYKCHDSSKFVPCQPFIIVPDT